MTNRRQIVGIFLILVMVILAACAPAAPLAPAAAPAPAPAALAPAAPAKAAWEAKWEKVVEAAQKERLVTFATTAAPETRFTLGKALKQNFGISSESITGGATELAEKVLRERRAGLYMWDLIMGAASTIYALKDRGALEPLEPVLILPDVTDPELIKKIWWEGELLWLDKDHMALGSVAEPEPVITLNTNLVQPGEVRGYKDLLDPKWKGKITLRDFRVGGGGQNWLRSVMQSGLLSWDYMQQLAKQEPVIIRDSRLQADWLAHGKYAIGIATLGTVVEPLVAAGAPLRQVIPAEGTHLSLSSSPLALPTGGPHPNAAKVFINWFLTKEGQTLASRTMFGQSLRMDVTRDHLRPEQLLQPGIKYAIGVSEEIVLSTPVHVKKATEVFGIK